MFTIMASASRVEELNGKVTSAPVLVLYPMHDKCQFATWNYFQQTLNTTARCIETGSDETWLVNRVYDVPLHGDVLCEELHADPVFRNGNFSIVSFSYGGMMARYVIEYCHFPYPVRNLVTFGAPLNGISSITSLGRKNMIGSFLDWVVDELIGFSIFDRIIQAADYWRDPTNYNSFITSSRFLAEANNEANFNATKKDIWMKLNKALFIKWEDDQTIIPSESSWWGQYDEDFNVVDRHETRLFEEDLLGLQHLEFFDKARYLTLPGDHMVFNYTQINDFVLPILRL